MASVPCRRDPDGSEPSGILGNQPIVGPAVSASDLDPEAFPIGVGTLVSPTRENGFEKHHSIPAPAPELIKAALHLVGIDDRCVDRCSETLEELPEFFGSPVVHQSSTNDKATPSGFDTAVDDVVAPRRRVV